MAPAAAGNSIHTFQAKAPLYMSGAFAFGAYLRYPHAHRGLSSFIIHNGDMKYISRLGWGIVIYALMYLTWNGFAIYGFTYGIVPRLCELLVLVIVSTVAGRSLRLNSWKDILPYSFLWALTALGLDYVITVPLSGVQIYANWNLWIGYALVMLLPLAAPQTRIYRDDIGHIS